MKEIDYIINHKRFKKKYSISELDKYHYSEKRISKFPQTSKSYYKFFNDHAIQNYKLIPTKCLCDNNDDILLSKSDRHCVEFHTVVCKKCGLIRAKDYFTDENTKDFYENYYRPGANSININHAEIDLKTLFNDQVQNSKERFYLINKYKIKNIRNKKILDLGKIPALDEWSQEIALDDLMTQSALQSFSKDQAELDDRIRSFL